MRYPKIPLIKIHSMEDI